MEGVMFLQAVGYYSGSIGDFLNAWAEAGFFAYLLPFLLLFALIYAILNSIKIFQDNKGVSGVIAFTVALMSLQFGFVPQFFSEIFPRMGVALAIILVLLIVAGIFVDPSKGAIGWTLLGIGAVIFIIVLINTAGSLGWYSAFWWYENWPLVAGAVFILVIIAIIVGGSNTNPNNTYKPLAFFAPPR